MSKTFEEITRPDNGPLVELNNNMQEVFSQYRKMREYASYLEYQLKQKDEHILKVENENSFLRDKHTTFDSNGKSVEPIITQQALPVVPECVGDGIAWDEQSDKSISEVLEDVFTTDDKDLKESGLWIKNNPEKYIIARNIGYTVEKPQLFYLKNKMTGLNLVLEQSFNVTGKHVGERFREFDMQYIATDEQEARLYKNTFSKAEINNMETGSYEQIKSEED